MVGFPGGMRIATSRGGRPAPRNDMLKLAGCSRVQGRPPTVIARSEATRQSASPAAAQSREQRLRRIRRRATDLPEVVPTWQVSLGGCGLPRRGAAAPLLAMTCRRRTGVRGYKDVLPSEFVGGCGLAPAGHTCKRRPAQVLDCHCALAHADTRHVSACHCEERSDVAIRVPAEILGKQVLLRANS